MMNTQQLRRKVKPLQVSLYSQSSEEGHSKLARLW